MALLPDPQRCALEHLKIAEVQRPPVDPEFIVRHNFGSTVARESLNGHGYSVNLGRIGAVVLVNQDDPITRQRFTIAHEIAHLELLRSSPSKVTLKESERWCERFAAELLMPRPWIERDIRSVSEPRFVNAFFDLAKNYQVSLQAFAIRVCDVIPAAFATTRRETTGTWSTRWTCSSSAELQGEIDSYCEQVKHRFADKHAVPASTKTGRFTFIVRTISQRGKAIDLFVGVIVPAKLTGTTDQR